MYGHERSLVKDLSGKPFALIGVNTDDDRLAIQRIARAKQLTWRSFFDGPQGEICRLYKVQGFPTLLLIDPSGVIRKKWLGAPASSEIDQAINLLLQNDASTL